MIQHPSKYHPNPLSHFLSLHSSAANHLHHPSSHSGQPLNHHQLSNADVANSLDVGKSFTIAAILGLQKNAIESSQKELNNAMNLSLNGHHSHHQSLHHPHHKGSAMGISNNNSSSNHSALSVNNFDCDNLSAASVVQRYLPAAAAAAAVVNGVNCGNQGHFRLNHFAPHLGNGSASGGQSALQSLQQLHQHHAQQVSLGFQSRDKTKSEHISNKKSTLKSKRVRTIFTPEQLERLEAEFERQQYMVGPERLYLAHTLQLTEAQVKVWFQNRRIKWRKHHLEITQQRLAFIRQRQVPTTEDATNAECPPDPEKPVAAHLHRSESDLSICNDSLDAESVPEGEDG